MMKKVVAVAPFRRKGIINFKHGPYDAWKEIGGQTALCHYPFGIFKGLFHKYELPLFIPKSKNEARLRFIEPITRKFDAFPDYLRFEIIPVIWDCWPCLDQRLCNWLKKHKVKTAIFTSKQNADRIQRVFPDMNILVITEGIDVSLYHAGKDLIKRSIDLLEFGRTNKNVFKEKLPSGLRHVCTNVNGKLIYTDEELFYAQSDTKITITLPRCDTDPQIAAGVETLTQRYWEAMLSRMIMLGRAPRELTDLIGYNPVIDLDAEHAAEQIADILAHIDEYQPLVDRNRETALRMADWTLRMTDVMKFLDECGYVVK